MLQWTESWIIDRRPAISGSRHEIAEAIYVCRRLCVLYPGRASQYVLF